MSLDNQ